MKVEMKENPMRESKSQDENFGSKRLGEIRANTDKLIPPHYPSVPPPDEASRISAVLELRKLKEEGKIQGVLQPGEELLFSLDCVASAGCLPYEASRVGAGMLLFSRLVRPGDREDPEASSKKAKTDYKLYFVQSSQNRMDLSSSSLAASANVKRSPFGGSQEVAMKRQSHVEAQVRLTWDFTVMDVNRTVISVSHHTEDLCSISEFLSHDAQARSGEDCCAKCCSCRLPRCSLPAFICCACCAGCAACYAWCQRCEYELVRMEDDMSIDEQSESLAKHTVHVVDEVLSGEAIREALPDDARRYHHVNHSEGRRKTKVQYLHKLFLTRLTIDEDPLRPSVKRAEIVISPYEDAYNVMAFVSMLSHACHDTFLEKDALVRRATSQSIHDIVPEAARDVPPSVKRSLVAETRFYRPVKRSGSGLNVLTLIVGIIGFSVSDDDADLAPVILNSLVLLYLICDYFGLTRFLVFLEVQGMLNDVAKKWRNDALLAFLSLAAALASFAGIANPVGPATAVLNALVFLAFAITAYLAYRQKRNSPSSLLDPETILEAADFAEGAAGLVEGAKMEG
uniref:Uncharacterized protein n=1 Tax=Pinguiococcus pyrenoidosus TaxID=172671 RepID=A0A7R9U0W3_9STRA|mmetsp:Transcript_10626/g.40020  ORF Transcript_10626/g.40020 Transcript_10626/m.40020 type:complete len:568 (+) Transcript_10626:138-1841(+)